MKYILILLTISTLLISNEIKKQKLTIGAGLYIQTQPYTNVKDIVLPSPVIFFDNELFYVRWSRYGMYFLGNKTDDLSWGLSLTLRPRVYGYSSSDITGMDKRNSSLEGGIAFSAKKGDSHVEIIALTDIIYENSAWVLETEIGHDFKYKQLSIYPSFIAIYQSSRFTDYYYGITQKEATRNGVNRYIPNAGLQLGVQTFLEYPLTEKLSALVNLRADKISSQANNSPLTNDTYIYSGLASLIYTFEY